MVQRTLVQENGGNLPGVLPAAAVAILTYMSSPEGQLPTRLYSYERRTLRVAQNRLTGINCLLGASPRRAPPRSFYNLLDCEALAALEW